MVIILDKHKRPMGFTTSRRARILLERGRATVHKIYPFTIRIKDVDSRVFETKTYQIKIDPGSNKTGIAIVEESTGIVCLLIQIEHRGGRIVSKIKTRSATRRNHRNRKIRYRRCKWENYYHKAGSKYKAQSPRPKGWLPPSIQSIADNIVNWVVKLSKLIRITKASIESVKFDTQLMNNPNISGVEYQHGTLFGYEVIEYLLEKYGHTCQYCGGASGDNTLQKEHIISKHNGGTDKIRNLTIACKTCNDAKDHRNLDSWLEDLKKQPKVKLTEVRISLISSFLAGHPLCKKNYAAWVNSYRNYLVKSISNLDNIQDVEIASGGLTKFNRQKLGIINKEHPIDALCVGVIPEGGYKNMNQKVLCIKAQGRGNRLRGQINSCGIITNKYRDNSKIAYGFQTGDIVVANIPKGKYAGQHTGRVVIRKNGDFQITTAYVKIPHVSYKYCILLQRKDGFSYALKSLNCPQLVVSASLPS